MKRLLQILAVGVTLGLAQHPIWAQQASPVPSRTDCNLPNGSVEQWICSSRHLRQLQDQIADGADRLIQLSPRGQAIQGEQLTWNNDTYRRRALGNVYLREALIERLKEIRRTTSVTEAALKATHTAEDGLPP